MPMILPATTDVIIKTADVPITTLFTVRCTQNVEITWQKEITPTEEIGIVEPFLEDLTMVTQVFKVTGDLVSTAGASPEQGDDDLVSQYEQFKYALEFPPTDDAFWSDKGLLQIEIQTKDGNIIEKGHFQSASITFVEGETVKARVNFDFIVGSDYFKL